MITYPPTILEARPTSCTTTEPDFTAISDTTRNIILLAANPNRKSVRIVNKNGFSIPLRECAPASVRLYSALIPANGDLVLDYPACIGALYAYFPVLPENRIFITERN